MRIHTLSILGFSEKHARSGRRKWWIINYYGFEIGMLRLHPSILGKYVKFVRGRNAFLSWVLPLKSDWDDNLILLQDLSSDVLAWLSLFLFVFQTKFCQRFEFAFCGFQQRTVFKRQCRHSLTSVNIQNSEIGRLLVLSSTVNCFLSFLKVLH